MDAAKEALLKLHGRGFDADKRILSIQESLLKKKLKEKGGPKNKDGPSALAARLGKSLTKNFRHFRRSEVLRPFLIIALLSVIQQFSGMTILRAYVVKIFGKIFSLQQDQKHWQRESFNLSAYNESGKNRINEKIIEDCGGISHFRVFFQMLKIKRQKKLRLQFQGVYFSLYSELIYIRYYIDL
jgi:hypothetical protein